MQSKMQYVLLLCIQLCSGCPCLVYNAQTVLSCKRMRCLQAQACKHCSSRRCHAKKRYICQVLLLLSSQVHCDRTSECNRPCLLLNAQPPEHLVARHSTFACCMALQCQRPSATRNVQQPPKQGYTHLSGLTLTAR